MRSLVGLMLVALAAPGLWSCRAGCDEGGKHHDDGDRWICSDGCNECACSDGVVSGTNIGCPGGAGGSGGKHPAADTGGAGAQVDASVGGDDGTSAKADGATPCEKLCTHLETGCGADVHDHCVEVCESNEVPLACTSCCAAADITGDWCADGSRGGQVGVEDCWQLCGHDCEAGLNNEACASFCGDLSVVCVGPLEQFDQVWDCTIECSGWRPEARDCRIAIREDPAFDTARDCSELGKTSTVCGE